MRHLQAAHACLPGRGSAPAKVGIDDDSDQRFLVELEKHFEIVARTLQQLGMAHLGFVDVLMIVLVLDDSKDLRQ